jgi:hypothetical protein
MADVPKDGRPVERVDDLSEEELAVGTVLLVVQDGKVVQIELAEKFRLR